jgi:AraC family transcriptional regulator
MAVRRYGVAKYGSAGLLASSAGRGWSDPSAEFRSHHDAVATWKSTQPETELAEIASAIVSELQTQTSAGRLLAETLASSLAARLVQDNVGSSPARRFPPIAQGGLDRRRLSRVLGYIEANLEGDLTIDRLASIACLSRFHFARAFKAAMGRSPHQYISAKRLDRAKALLMRRDQSLVDIALALNFSCQANFTRAFRQVTGQTPGQYRRNSL